MPHGNRRRFVLLQRLKRHRGCSHHPLPVRPARTNWMATTREGLHDVGRPPGHLCRRREAGHNRDRKARPAGVSQPPASAPQIWAVHSPTESPFGQGLGFYMDLRAWAPSAKAGLTTATAERRICQEQRPTRCPIQRHPWMGQVGCTDHPGRNNRTG